MHAESTTNSNESGSTISSDAEVNAVTHVFPEHERQCGERTLLDLYSGCGGMSTGLCLGANSSGVKLVTVSFTLSLNYNCSSYLALPLFSVSYTHLLMNRNGLLISTHMPAKA